MSMKTVDPREFRDSGLLQEVNRQWFHPRGLALYVTVDSGAGTVGFGGILDARDDPEGFLFAPEEPDAAKAVEAARLLETRLAARIALGCDSNGIQPLPIPAAHPEEG